MGTTFVFFQSSGISPDCHDLLKMIKSSLVTAVGFLHNLRSISTKICRNHCKNFLGCFLKYVLYLRKLQFSPICCTDSIWPGVQQLTFSHAIRVFKILLIKLAYRLTFDLPTAFEKPTWSKEKDSSPHQNKMPFSLINYICWQTSLPHCQSYPCKVG